MTSISPSSLCSNANKEAGAQGVRLNTGLAAAEVFDRARERGWGKKDFSSVVEGLR